MRTQCLIIGKNADINHPLLQKFVKARSEAFIAAFGNETRYKEPVPLELDTLPGTVFIVAQDNVTDEIVGGTRLSIATPQTASKLPITLGKPREDGNPSTINLDVDTCPHNTAVIEYASLFTTKGSEGKGVGSLVSNAAMSYVKEEYKSTPYIFLSKTVPMSTGIIARAFAKLGNAQRYNSKDTGEYVYSPIPYDGKDYTLMAVQATTNLSKEHYDLSQGVTIKYPWMTPSTVLIGRAEKAFSQLSETCPGLLY